MNFPYFANGKHVNTKHRTIGNDPRHYWMEPGAERPFYNLDAIDPTQPLIIVEGEGDALSIHEAGLSNVVSVPGGAPEKEGQNLDKKLAASSNAFDLLQAVPQVILATDNDGPGFSAQTELARRIGVLKCRRA